MAPDMSAREAGIDTATVCEEPSGNSTWRRSRLVPFDGGYPSRTTCAFTPEIPNALTPARGGRPGADGQSVASVRTRTGSCCQSTSVLGFRKCNCGGSTPCCMARTVLIKPATPAAGSKWPMLVFTEPISSGRSGWRPLPYTAAAACTSMESPNADPAP